MTYELLRSDSLDNLIRRVNLSGNVLVSVTNEKAQFIAVMLVHKKD